MKNTHSLENQLQLIRNWKDNRCYKSRNKLIVQFLDLLHNNAYKLKYRNPELIEDLVQEGVFGLIKAIDKFDFTKGVKPITFFSWYIKEAMYKYVEKNAGIIVHASKSNATRKIFWNFSDITGDDNKVTHRSIVDFSTKYKVKEEVIYRSLMCNPFYRNDHKEIDIDDFPDTHNLSPEEHCIKTRMHKKVQKTINE